MHDLNKLLSGKPGLFCRELPVSNVALARIDPYTTGAPACRLASRPVPIGGRVEFCSVFGGLKCQTRMSYRTA